MKGTTKVPFVVGRRTARGTTVVIVKGANAPVVPVLRGPWTLRAVVAP